MTDTAPAHRCRAGTGATLLAGGALAQVYQQLNNYDDNALVWFERSQQSGKRSSLYKRGMAFQNSMIDRFAEDLASRRLPRVS